MSAPRSSLVERVLLVTATVVACGTDPAGGGLAVDALGTGDVLGQAGPDSDVDVVGSETSDLAIVDAKLKDSEGGLDAPACFAAPQIRPWCRLKWGAPPPAWFVESEAQLKKLNFKCAEYAPDAVILALDWSVEKLAFRVAAADGVLSGSCCDSVTELVATVEVCPAAGGELVGGWGGQGRCCGRMEKDDDGVCQASSPRHSVAYRVPRNLAFWHTSPELMVADGAVDYPKGDPACRVWGPYDHPWPEGTGPATLPK